MWKLSIIALLFQNPYKLKTIQLIFIASVLGTQHKGGTTKTTRNQENASEWNNITCLSDDRYLSDLALYNQT